MKVSAALLLLLLAGCRTASEPAGDRIRVAVSVPPQADLVRRIGGDRVAVESLLAPGASDEDLALSPRKALALERVQLYVKVGHPAFRIEGRYIDPLLARRPEVGVVDMSRGILGLALAGEDDGHGHEGGDPHVWVSPQTMAAAARNVAAALAEIDPGHASSYQGNLARFLSDVDHLDREIRARLAGGRRTFLVYHPSWGYFARQYGLTQIAIEAEGKEPGAARLIRLIDRARQEGAEVVLVPGGYPRESALVIAEAIGGRIVEADPQSPDWEETLLRIAEALHG